jgi:hypothetical protein
MNARAVRIANSKQVTMDIQVVSFAGKPIEIGKMTNPYTNNIEPNFSSL